MKKNALFILPGTLIKKKRSELHERRKDSQLCYIFQEPKSTRKYKNSEISTQVPISLFPKLERN